MDSCGVNFMYFCLFVFWLEVVCVRVCACVCMCAFVRVYLSECGYICVCM